jgi:L-alanine-DL-glutamate epimerase-like enolase superfamily enzyme
MWKLLSLIGRKRREKKKLSAYCNEEVPPEDLEKAKKYLERLGKIIKIKTEYDR